MDITPNWFVLLQTTGIVFSILLSGYALFRDTRARKVGNYLQLVQFHREVWKMTLDYPELQRVREHGIDLLADPPTPQEMQFLTFLFLHITCTFELQQTSNLTRIERLEYDINELLKFPLIRRFWEENKRYYNDSFVKFVERSAKIRQHEN